MIKILYAGRISAIKDLPTLKKAAKILKAKLIINSSYSHAKSPQVYRSADIVVVPTLSLALDKVFLEALACGVPTIGSDIGYPFMVNKFPQLIFEAGDPQDLARKIMWLVKNKAKTGKIISSAREFIRKNFDLNVLMDKIVYEFINAST